LWKVPYGNKKRPHTLSVCGFSCIKILSLVIKWNQAMMRFCYVRKCTS
jgi:hypothetical protein